MVRKVTILPELVGFTVGKNPKLPHDPSLETDNGIQRDDRSCASSL